VLNASSLSAWRFRVTPAPDCLNVDCSTTFGGSSAWSAAVSLPSPAPNSLITYYVLAVCLNPVFDCKLYVSLNFNNTSPTATDPPILSSPSSPIAPQPSVSALFGLSWCTQTTVSTPCSNFLPSRFNLAALSNLTLILTPAIATAGAETSYTTSTLQPDATFSVQYFLFAGTGSAVSSSCSVRLVSLNYQAAATFTASCNSMGSSGTCSYDYSSYCPPLESPAYTCSNRGPTLYSSPAYPSSVGSCAITVPNVYLTALASGESVVSSVLQVDNYQVGPLLVGEFASIV
jgi:hypothetical protein